MIFGGGPMTCDDVVTAMMMFQLAHGYPPARLLATDAQFDELRESIVQKIAQSQAEADRIRTIATQRFEWDPWYRGRWLGLQLYARGGDRPWELACP